MSARDACSVIVAGERKSLVLSSFKGTPGTFRIPAYSTGGFPPAAWVMSAVSPSLGSVLRSVQESPPSLVTKIGAVALVDPPGLGVKAEAAMNFGFEPYSARNGSASCQVSPLSEAGIRSTTRTPVSLAGGCDTCRSGSLQATSNTAATAIAWARMLAIYLRESAVLLRGLNRQPSLALQADPIARLHRQDIVRLSIEQPRQVSTQPEVPHGRLVLQARLPHHEQRRPRLPFPAQHSIGAERAEIEVLIP